MAIQLPNFAPIASGGMGEFDLGRAIHSGLENYNKFLDVKNKPKALAEALLAQQLQNKINFAKAKYAEENEAAGLAHTRAGTTNLQDTHGLQGLRRALIEQELKGKKASTSKTEAINNLMQNILSGNQGQVNASGNTQVSPVGYGINQDQTNIENNEEGNYQNVAMQQPQPNKSNISYPQAALLSQLLGLGKPNMIDVNGEKLAVTPFGNISVAKGQNTFEKELSKQNAKSVSELDHTVNNATDSQATLDALGEVVKSKDPTSNIGKI
jgi:hypothetical protein